MRCYEVAVCVWNGMKGYEVGAHAIMSPCHVSLLFGMVASGMMT